MKQGKIAGKRKSWGAAILAMLVSLSAFTSVSVAAAVTITPDANLFLDRVDRVYPDVSAAEKQLKFFKTNLLANQQPDGRTDNFPQKVTVSNGTLLTGNIVSNRGFEAGTSSAAAPDSWSYSGAAQFTWVNDVQAAFEAARMIKMEALSESGGVLSQTIANPLDVLVDYVTPATVTLKPNSLMLFSAYVKKEQVTGSGQGVYAKVSFKDANGAVLEIPYVFTEGGGGKGTQDWTEIRGLVTVPAVQPDSIVVEAGLDGASGTVYWDGVRLMRLDTSISTAAGSAGVQVGNKGAAAIPNANFDATPAWTENQLNGTKATIDQKTSSGLSGKGVQIVSSSINTVASVSMLAKASSNGTRQFGGDYRVFSVKYKTLPGFTAADGRGVAAKISYNDKDGLLVGSKIFYGSATEGSWKELSGIFDAEYPAYTMTFELMLDQAVGTVIFDNASFIGMDQQNSSTEAGFGAAGLFAYMWKLSGKTDELLAKQARKALDFYLHNRVQLIDNPANSDKLLTGAKNSGEAYVPYYVSGSTTGADYPTTAFGLHNLASTLKYGQELFTTEQLAEGKEKAYSMWKWLTRVTKFSTQKSQNQALVALLGGIELAVLYDDQALKNEIYNYYTKGIPGTNLPNEGGFRKEARQEVDGKHIFYEVNGFDVSYAGVSLSDLAEIINEIPDQDAGFKDFKSIIHADGMEMAQYFNSRLSADGWIFAGSRHNEGGGSSFNMGNFSGLSYWAQELNSDLGRFLIKGPSALIPSYGETANLGHIAVHGPVALHHMLQKYAWVSTEQQKLEDYTFRKGKVSAYFKNDNRQPLTISVSGTDFTENLIDSGTVTPTGPKIDRVMGMYFKDGNDQWLYDDVKASTSNMATPNYYVRKDTGVSTSTSNITKQYYITNGTSLYNVLAVQFSSDQSYKSLNQLIGLPYMSVPDYPYVPGSIDPNMVRINGIYASDGSPLLDLTQDTGEASASEVRAGKARINGWPGLKAVNAPAGGTAKPTWLSSADINQLNAGFTTTNGKVMDDLYSKALWDPTNVRTSDNNGVIVQFANSDKLMVKLTDSAAPAAYKAGEWVYFVAKYAPDSKTGSFSVTPVQTYSTRSDVLQAITVEDEGMKLVLSGGNDLFIDKQAGMIRFNGNPAAASELANLWKEQGRTLANDRVNFPYLYDLNGDGIISIEDLSLLGLYINKQ
ncbi:MULTISPECIES: hypothetical protein [unclassified Paenibacillus]|uniref:hypothetical protein n=1 Tax=unclassified Paenibacillus TaxID=185978 RepID=UPI00363FDC75